MKNSNQKKQIQSLTTGAILTAIVVVFQFLAIYTRPLFPVFSITLVLIPVVLGAALCDAKVSTWLGFVFGVVVLLSGDAALFMGFSVVGTVVTVLLKGTLCGLATGLVYKALSKSHKKAAIWVAAVVCPIVNSGVFALGCYVFFLKDLTDMAAENGFASATAFIFLGMIGINFIVELIINIILNPTVTTVMKALKTVK